MSAPATARAYSSRPPPPPPTPTPFSHRSDITDQASTTTVVFTSTRHLVQPPSRPSTPPLDSCSMASGSAAVVLDYGRHRSRWQLSESQLMRHGQGASDLRSTIVQSKTPAGFIRFNSSASPPTTPALSPPPMFNPNESLYFPPVVVVPPPAARSPNPPPAPPPLLSQFAPITAPPRSPGGSDSPLMSPIPNLSPPELSPLSGISSSSTLVQSTDMVNNAPRASSSRSSSSRMSSRRTKELSLTELLDVDWAGQPIPPARRKGRSARENDGVENMPVSAKRRSTRRSKDGSPKETGTMEVPSLEQEMERAQSKLRKIKLVEAVEQSLRDNSPDPVSKKERLLSGCAVERVKSKGKHGTHKLVDYGRSDCSLMSKPG